MNTSESAFSSASRGAVIWGFFLVAALAVMPLLGVSVPRFLAYGLPLSGALLTAFYPRVFGAWPRLPTAGFLAAGVFCALAALSALWAADSADAFGRALRLSLVLLPGMLVVALVAIAPENVLRRWMKPVPVFLGVAALLLGLESAFGFPVYRFIHHLPASAVSDQRSVLNRGATVIVLCCFAALPLAQNLHRFGAALLLAACLPLIALTESQSVQLAYGIGLVFLLAFPHKRKSAWIVLDALVAGLILGAPWLAHWMYAHLAAALNATPFFGKGAGFAGDRLEIWDFVARYIMKNPLYGFGVEATRGITFDAPLVYHKSAVVLHPHNFALQLWIEFGVFGAAAGAGFFGFLLRKIYKEAPSALQRPALACVMATLTVGAMTYGIWQGWWLGLLVLLTGFIALSWRNAGGQKDPVTAP